MDEKRERLEKTLGGRIQGLKGQPLPGLASSSTFEVVYFADDGSSDLYSQFDRLSMRIDPPLATDGGATTTKHTLKLPGQDLFHAIKYRGDIQGWRNQIAEGAKALGVTLGRIENGSLFVLSDGRTYPLSECEHGTA